MDAPYWLEQQCRIHHIVGRFGSVGIEVDKFECSLIRRQSRMYLLPTDLTDGLSITGPDRLGGNLFFESIDLRFKIAYEVDIYFGSRFGVFNSQLFFPGIDLVQFFKKCRIGNIQVPDVLSKNPL